MPRKNKIKKMEDEDIELSTSDSGNYFEDLKNENSRLRQELMSIKRNFLNLEKKYNDVLNLIEKKQNIENCKEAMPEEKIVVEQLVEVIVSNPAGISDDNFPHLPGTSSGESRQKTSKLPNKAAFTRNHVKKNSSKSMSPPIIMDIENLNIHKLSQLLVSVVGNKFSLTIRSDKVVIHTDDVSVREIIIENIKNLHFHTYSTIHSKPHNLLIKGLPRYYPEEQIAQSLLEQLPDVKIVNLKVFQIPNRFKRNNPNKYQNIKIWQLILEPVKDINKVLDIKNLLNVNVVIEKFHFTDITQELSTIWSCCY